MNSDLPQPRNPQEKVLLEDQAVVLQQGAVGVPRLPVHPIQEGSLCELWGGKEGRVAPDHEVEKEGGGWRGGEVGEGAEERNWRELTIRNNDGTRSSQQHSLNGRELNASTGPFKGLQSEII